MHKPWNETKSQYLVSALHDADLYEAFTECYSACSLNIKPRSDHVINETVRRICDSRGIKSDGARSLIKVGCKYL